MRYEPIDPALATDPDALASDRPPAELLRAVIAIGLYSTEVAAAEKTCLRLAGHADPNVRGNALLALGHLAHRFGMLTGSSKLAVEAGLSDPSEFVRGQADASADDLDHYLGWRLVRPTGAD
jgi:hypothetical protein